MSAWTDLAVTVLATWPPAAVAFYANWVKTKNHVATVATQQNDTIAAITTQAVTGQNADIRKIATDVAAEQTKQLLEEWPPAKQNPQIEAAAEAAAPVALAAGKTIMNYVIAPAKRHVDAWLAQNHIDPSQVVRVTNPDTLDTLDGALVVVLNPSALSGPAAEAAEKARELESQGKVTLRTDQT
jgi:hypothetical protein